MGRSGFDLRRVAAVKDYRCQMASPVEVRAKQLNFSHNRGKNWVESILRFA